MKTYELMASMLVIMALAEPAAAAVAVGGGGFVYQAFPALPLATVKESNFVSALRDTCEVLGSGSKFAKGPPNICNIAAGARLPVPAALSDQLAEARKACSPRTQAGVDAVFTFLQGLGETCQKLHKARPDALGTADVERLREARDTPEVLEVARLWSGDKPDDFREALNGSQGKTASGDVPGLPSLGAVSDQVIRGMAEFLQKRAQEEALRYLRTQLKAALCDGTGDEGALRKEVFSNVCSALDMLDDGMSLEALGGYMRAAAESDLRKLPDVSLDYVQHVDPSRAPLTFSARLGIAYLGALKEGRDPFEVLYSLGELDRQSCEAKDCSEVGAAFRLASAFAYALRQGGSDWQDAFDADNLKGADRPVVTVAVLLLAEKRLASLGPRGEGVFSVEPEVIQRMLLDPLGVLSDALAMVKSWQALEERSRKAGSEDTRRESLLEAMPRAAGAFLHMASTLERIRSGKPSAGLAEGEQRARAFVGVDADLTRRNYAPAIVAALEQLRLMVARQRDLPASVNRYLPLVVEIASAQSSNDVAAAFDAYAAPLATYELKYKRPFVAINGFLGVHYGQERMNSDGVQGTSSIIGAFAPVGIHASLPAWEKLYVGVLLSVLDLGAITTARTGEEPKGNLDGATAATPKADTAAEIGLPQVFSPGAYLTVGLFNSPFVVGGGFSFSPELREVHQDGLTEQVSVLRYGVFVGVDVPILPLD